MRLRRCNLDCRFLVALRTVPFVQSLGAKHDWSISRWYQELKENIQLVLDGSARGPDYRDPTVHQSADSQFVANFLKAVTNVELFISPQCLPLVDFLASWLRPLRMRPNALARGCAKLGPEVIRKLVGVELVDFLAPKKMEEELSRICPFFQSSVFPLSGLSSQMVYLRCPSVVRSFFFWTSSLSSLPLLPLLVLLSSVCLEKLFLSSLCFEHYDGLKMEKNKLTDKCWQMLNGGVVIWKNSSRSQVQYGSMMFDVFRIGSQGKFIPHLGLFNLLCLHLQVFLVEVCGNSVAGLRDIL